MTLCGVAPLPRVRVQLVGGSLAAAGLAGHLRKPQTPLQGMGCRTCLKAQHSMPVGPRTVVRTSCRPLVGVNYRTTMYCAYCATTEPVCVATRLHTWPLQARTSCAAGARTSRPAWWQPGVASSSAAHTGAALPQMLCAQPGCVICAPIQSSTRSRDGPPAAVRKVAVDARECTRFTDSSEQGRL